MADGWLKGWYVAVSYKDGAGRKDGEWIGGQVPARPGVRRHTWGSIGDRIKST